jgi:ABC-type transport system involved in multi-copper enzyme maturation permease subunit
MKWLEIVRFELAHQLRRRSTWVLFGLFLFPLIGVTSDDLVDARNREILFNAPVFIAQGGVVMGMVALLILAVVAGDAATRDVRARLEPLMHAAPVSRAAYLGGRFMGAFIVAATLVAAVPLAHILVPLTQPELAAEVIGPFRPAAYVQSYLLLMLPSAFVATALMFALATLARHALGSWVGAALLLAGAQFSHSYFGDTLGRWDLATALDPTALNAIDVMMRTWSPVELSQRLIGSESALLWNRGLWIAIACAMLVLTYWRFDFGANAGDVRWWRRGPLRAARSADGDVGDPGRPDGTAVVRGVPVAVPSAPREFDAAGRVRQTLSIARDSLREMVPTWVWPVVPLLVVAQAALTLEALGSMGPGTPGTPVLPTTGLVLRTLIPGAGDAAPPVILAIVLLPIILAGELVWRERDANIEALVDAAPVPDGVRFVGKLLGLWLVIIALFALVMFGGVLAQARLGWHDIDVGLYVRVLGLRLVIPLVFALFALSVHVLVNQKHLGHVIVLLLVAPLLGELLGIEHPLLLIGSVPNWRHSPISGFGPFLGPVLSFQLYWAAGALLLALVARLFWVRGVERGTGTRLRVARSRLTGATVGGVTVAAGLVLLAGGFVFYNTNVLNRYRTTDERAEERAEYERRYRRWAGVPQPEMRATELHVEIHPDRGEARVRGVHLLENRTDLPLDTLHVAISREVETRMIALDRPAHATILDDELGHRVYVLDEPLQPGDSLRLEWEVRHAPRGFPAGSISTAVVGNGSFIVMQEWMPLVGYQPRWELAGSGERREHGLPERAAVPSLDDPQAATDRYGTEHIDLAVTVGTAGNQIAVAPGSLVRSWTRDGRRYFRYETNAPIGNGYAIFSADYAVGRGRWGDVAIEVLHHPAHDTNVPRMIRGMEASLEQLTERFGPFPYDVLRMVEYPAPGGSLHAASATVWYQELFSLFDPDRDPRRIDLPFAVVAHEVAHQFQPVPARMEGRALLSESFAWYAAMGVIEEEYGTEHLERFLGFMRRSYLTPRSRADVPLLRANDSFLAYRKGPFAMYALREYVGQDRVDLAWRRLRERHASHEPPFATSLDLYRELREVTPDSLRTLLGDLLERNTFWELTTERATAEATTNGEWRVSIEIAARKVVVDTTGAETDMPLDDLVEIGVWAEEEDGGAREPLHLEMHRVRSGPQTITVTVSGRPARAGIDPRHLLIDVAPHDNVVDITEPSSGRE